MKDLFLVEVKQPDEVRQGWYLLTIKAVLPAGDVIHPLAAGNCPFVARAE